MVCRLQGCIAMDSVPSASIDTVRIQAGQVAAGRSGEYVFLGQMAEECPVTPQC